MRFIIGLLLGLGIGLAAALLLAPEKGQRRRDGEPLSDEASGAGEMGEDHDALVGLRRAMRGLQEQVQEAWEEAHQAAREAEQEMRARYQRAVPKRKR
jgi:gas vesicle protein